MTLRQPTGLISFLCDAVRIIALLVLSSGAYITAQNQDILISAAFDETECILGRETIYAITIKKADPSESFVLETPNSPELPKNSAITFGRVQTSEQYQSSEGNDPVGITLEFEAVPNREGRIIMPSFNMRYMGQDFVVPATSIHVRSPEFDLTGDEVEWMSLELADEPENLKVGQRVKTKLNLYVFKSLRNVTFTNPVPVGSDFSMDAISPGPTERVTTRGLYRYSVYSWPLTYTAVRSGLISVSFKIGVNFRIPNDRVEFIRAARSNDSIGILRIEELLQDSREESLTIFSENINVSVETLDFPEENDSFYGAIGDFKINVTVEDKNTEVGQPLNMMIEVEGEGNFGSFKKPVLNFDHYWRVFEPQEAFENIDFLNYKAKQSYQYVVIPLSSDITEIPSVPYTYYSVVEDKFVTKHSEAISIDLRGVSIVEKEDVLVEEVVVSEVEESENRLTNSITWVLGVNRPLGLPFFKTLPFYFVQAVFLVVFIMLVFWRLWVIRLQNDKPYARRRQIKKWVSKYLELAKSAAKEEDSEQFYESSFLAFCAIVSSKNDHNVEAITVEGVMSRIRLLDINDNAKRVVEGYLERYEYHRFSGHILDAPPLQHEFQRLKSILRKVESTLDEKGESK